MVIKCVLNHYVFQLFILEGSKTVEMCLKTMFLCTCQHLSHFSADFGGPYLNYVSINLTLEIVNHSLALFCQDV